jgi:hypothetical protein
MANFQIEKTEIELDTFGNTVHLVYNAYEQPLYYESNVFTPVCHTGKCLPVRITIQWDLGGDFNRFELKGDEILTKVEHIPFTETDYQMLHNILGNDQSELRNYHYEDLVFKGQDTVTAEVDGVSGATITGLKGHYVPDALFTSHTLWHLVNGNIRSLLAENTKNHLFADYPLVYFINRPELNCRRAAIQQVSINGNKNYVTVLKSILDTAQWELSLFALTEMGLAFDESENARIILSAVYDSTRNETAQKIILETYLDKELNDQEIEIITRHFGTSFGLFTSEYNVLRRQNQWPKISYEHVLAYVSRSQNLQRKEKAFSMLTAHKNQFSRKLMRKYKKVAKQNYLVDP